jgi:hypothetical protein
MLLVKKIEGQVDEKTEEKVESKVDGPVEGCVKGMKHGGKQGEGAKGPTDNNTVGTCDRPHAEDSERPELYEGPSPERELFWWRSS